MADDAAAEGRRALAAVATLLAEKPHKVGHDFSEATRCVVAFRDRLIARNRAAGSERGGERLEKANAVLTVIVGGHFPVGDVPWGQIEQARALLAEIAAG